MPPPHLFFRLPVINIWANWGSTRASLEVLRWFIVFDIMSCVSMLIGVVAKSHPKVSHYLSFTITSPHKIFDGLDHCSYIPLGIQQLYSTKLKVSVPSSVHTVFLSETEVSRIRSETTRICTVTEYEGNQTLANRGPNLGLACRKTKKGFLMSI